MTYSREEKINALFTLMKFSLIIPEETKFLIKDKISLFSDEEIDNIGSILATEHDNREKLDEMALKTFIDSLNKTVSKQ